MWLGGFHPGDPVNNVPDRPLAFICATVIGWSAIAAAATLVAFRRGATMLGRPRSWLLGIAVLTPTVLFAWMLFWGAQYPGNTIWVETRPGLVCLALTLAMAAWPLVALAYFSREKNPNAPAATGAARGVAMGGRGRRSGTRDPRSR